MGKELGVEKRTVYVLRSGIRIKGWKRGKLEFLRSEEEESKDRKPLKGLGHQMNIFLKAFKIKLILYIHALLVFKLFGCLVAEKNKFLMQEYVLYA